MFYEPTALLLFLTKLQALVFDGVKQFSIRLCASLTIALSISGCVSLPFLSSTDESSESISKEVVQGIDLFEEERTRNEVNELRNELENIKESIDRMLVLESEMKSVLEGVDIFSSPDAANSTSPSDVFALQSPNLSSTILSGGTSPLPTNPSQGSGVQDTKFSNVAVGAARVIKPNLTPSKNLPIDDKFSGTLKVPNGRADLASSNSKFSGLTAHSGAQCDRLKVGSGFALHVASFKNKAYAETLLKKVLPQVSAKEGCTKQGLIASVMVKEQQFFSARIGSYSSKEKAKEMCSQVKSMTNYCAVTVNQGEML